MMAKPSVLLPEPLGPIRAWISPRRISRLTPLRIGLLADADVQIDDRERVSHSSQWSVLSGQFSVWRPIAEY